MPAIARARRCLEDTGNDHITLIATGGLRSPADFAKALAFVNRIGAIAEDQNHHPDIKLTWGKVGVEIWTHKIDGLTESDFILAAKFDEAYQA